MESLEYSTREVFVEFNKSLNKCASYFAKGESQLQKGKLKKAQEFLLKALVEQPENPHILQALEKTGYKH